jgi:hypothetical protein
MKENNLLVASEHDVEAERNRRINDARTLEEMKEAVRYGQKPNGTFLGS